MNYGVDLSFDNCNISYAKDKMEIYLSSGDPEPLELSNTSIELKAKSREDVILSDVRDINR